MNWKNEIKALETALDAFMALHNERAKSGNILPTHDGVLIAASNFVLANAVRNAAGEISAAIREASQNLR